MGNEILRDSCPQKYCKKGNLFVDALPVLLAAIVVAYFSGSLFKGGGMEATVIIIIEAVFIFGIYGIFYVLMGGMKKRLAETYISVCDNGICGICPINGYKNREFSSTYSEITKVTVKGERIFIDTASGRITLTLNNASAAADVINLKIPVNI